MADEGFKIADAYVEVHATANQGDAEKAAEEIEAEADAHKPKVKVGAEADKTEGVVAGEEIAQSAGQGFSSRTSFLRGIFGKTVKDSQADAARAALDGGDLAGAQFALGFERDALGNLRNAAGELVSGGLAGVEGELARLGSQGGSRFSSGLLGSILPGIARFGSALESVGPKISSLGAGITKIGVINIFATLATGAINFGAALGPILGLIAAIPAVALSAAAALSTLAVGLSGVFGAFSAFGKTTGGGGGGGGGGNSAQQIRQLQQAVTAAAQSVQQAEHGIVISERDVADAQHATMEAQQALTQARLDAARALEQYQNAVADASLSEQQAQFDLTDAQTVLNNYQKIGITSGENYQKAQLAVAEAQQKLKEAQEKSTNAQQDNQQAQAKGVDGSDQVVQATDQLNKALEQQSDAVYNVGQAQQQLTNAEQQLADAQYNLTHSAGSGGAAGAMNQFNAALAKLSPNARSFVLAVISLRGQFEALKHDVQDRLFAGLDQEVLTTAKVTFPTLRTGMDLVATSFNNMAKAGFEAVKTPIFQGALATVFRGTAQATQMWAQATGPLLTGLANLAAVGMPFILRFTQALTGWLTAKGTFLSTAEGAQHMHDILQKASDAASNLWHIGEHLFEALKNIGGAMHVDNLLASLSKITDEFAKWTASAQGQQQLSGFFQMLTQTASKTAQILPLVWDVVSKIINFLEAHPAIKNLVEDFIAWSIVLGPVVGTAGKLVGLIGGIAGAFKEGGTGLKIFNKLFGEAGLAMKAWGIASGIAGTAAKVLSGEMSILDVVMDANPVMLVVIAIAALTAAFVWAYLNIKPFREAVNEVAQFIKTVAVEAFKILSAVVVTVFSLIANIVIGTVQIVIGTISLLSRIPGDVGGWFMSAYLAIVSALGAAVSFVGGIPGRIIGALGDVGSMLYSAGSAIIHGLARGISDAVGAVTGAIKGVFNAAKNLIPNSPAKEGPFSGQGWTLYSGQAIMQDLGVGIESQTGALKQSVTKAMLAASAPFKVGIAGPQVGGSNLPSAFANPGGLQPVNNTTTTGSTITVGQLTLQVNGAMDLTSDSDRKKLARKIRDELVKLEASTR